MGDLNTGYFQPSQQLLRNGQVDADGKSWQIPMTFSDAWAELHPGNPDPSTINDDPVRLDAWLFYVNLCDILYRIKRYFRKGICEYTQLTGSHRYLNGVLDRARPVSALDRTRVSLGHCIGMNWEQVVTGPSMRGCATTTRYAPGLSRVPKGFCCSGNMGNRCMIVVHCTSAH